MVKMIDMPRLDRAFNQVRGELFELGLLDDGVYLDRIDCVRAALPTLSRLGYVYDRGVWWLPRLAGFREGAIYVPINAPVEARVPGSTLADVIRHEYAHAWAWLDRRRVDGRWFREAFGGRYNDEAVVEKEERAEAERDFRRSGWWEDFASPYAMTRPAEDWAETFMVYLRHRRSLERFRGRRGLMRKLRAVGKAVRETRGDLRRSARS